MNLREVFDMRFLRYAHLAAIALVGMLLASCGGSSGISNANAGGVIPPAGGAAPDPSQLLYVPEFHSDNSEYIAWYPVSVSGNDPLPIATLNTSFFYPTNDIRSMAIDPNGNLYALIDGHTIAVYPPGASGNAAPIRTIGAPELNGELMGILAIGADAAGNLYAIGHTPTKSGVIAVYKPGATSPDHEIAGPQTGLSNPTGVAFDREGRIVVSNRFGGPCGEFGSVTVYASRATGNASPIEFYNTDVADPVGVALDSQDDIYVVSSSSGPSGVTVAVFPRSAHNPPPEAVLKGPFSAAQQYAIGVDTNSNVYVAFGSSVGVWPPFSSWLSSGATPPSRVIGLSTYIQFASILVH